METVELETKVQVWDKPADATSLEKAIKALAVNGIKASAVNSLEEAKVKVLTLIPHDAEVLTMTSITLEKSGINEVIDQSGQYNSVRNKLNQMKEETELLAKQKLGAAPEYALGSVHAITENGQVIIASNTGSQLPAYAYGATHVIWVVGTQKIVKDLDAGMERLNEYTLPLESARARKAYNLPETFNSAINKLLIVNKEVNPDRIEIIFIKENVGF